MTKQDVTNKCKEVAASTQAVLDVIRTLSSLCNHSSSSGNNLSDTIRREGDKLLRDITQTVDEAVVSIGNLVAAVTTGNKASFVNEAKFSATKLAQLIETAKSLGIEREGTKLKQASLKIISTGKIALRTPGDTLYKQQIIGAKELVEESLRLCAMAIQSKLLASTKSTIETGVLAPEASTPLPTSILAATITVSPSQDVVQRPGISTSLGGSLSPGVPRYNRPRATQLRGNWVSDPTSLLVSLCY